MDSVRIECGRARRPLGRASNAEAVCDAGCVLLHQALQRGRIPSMALVADRGAIGLLLGLPAGGLHNGLPRC